MKNMNFKRKLPVPKEIKEQYPLTAALAAVKNVRDAQIADIFTGKSDRMALIIGPCSADREDAVLDYCTRLAALQEQVKDRLILIPRVYTNKPRTTGEGYKGLLHQPDPERSEDMLEGVIAIRRLHTNVLANTGLSTADEMLYPDNYRYLSDLLSYVAVGARSVENQEHRLTSSGIDIPVGSEKTAFHLGNVFCVLAALLIGGFWGGMSGAVGLTIADLTSGYVTSAPKTFILKLCIGLIAGFVAHKIFHISKDDSRKVPMPIAAFLSSLAAMAFNVVADPVVGYFYKTYVLSVPQDAAAIWAKMGAVTTLVNAIIAVAVATVFYLALRPALKRTNLLPTV